MIELLPRNNNFSSYWTYKNFINILYKFYQNFATSNVFIDVGDDDGAACLFLKVNFRCLRLKLHQLLGRLRCLRLKRTCRTIIVTNIDVNVWCPLKMSTIWKQASKNSRQLSKCRHFGDFPRFKQILPIMKMSTFSREKISKCRHSS